MATTQDYINQLKQVMNDDVILVSIMYVNNEIGAVMPIANLGKIIKEYNFYNQRYCGCEFSQRVAESQSRKEKGQQ